MPIAALREEGPRRAPFYDGPASCSDTGLTFAPSLGRNGQDGLQPLLLKVRLLSVYIPVKKKDGLLWIREH